MNDTKTLKRQSAEEYFKELFGSKMKTINIEELTEKEVILKWIEK